MGTAKRERQKANRQVRLQELAKEARKEKSKRFASRIVLGVVAFLAVAVGIYFIGRDDSSTPAASDTTLGGTTTTASPNKPTVSIPTSIPTELKVTVLKEGSGTAAKAGDTITVNYVGVRSADGKEFDNSYDRGQPFTFTLGAGQVIAGWDQGLIGTKPGEQVQLDIPNDLAYKDQAAGDVIQPGDALTFVIDVVSITPAGTDTTTPTS